MMITRIKGTIKVSAINVPFQKNLRCVNAAEGEILFGGVPPELKAEGYIISMLAGYNLYLPTSRAPQNYGTQDLYLKLEQIASLPEIIQYYLDKYPVTSNSQNTSILPNRYGLIHETDTEVRVSGIGIDLENYLFIQNKCCNVAGLNIGDVSGEDFEDQGYIAIICAGIGDGSPEYGTSTQDLYVTYDQLKQIKKRVELFIRRTAENLATSEVL
jgi:hypothetical protein